MMCSRATSLDGLAVLQNFDKPQITKCWSEELDLHLFHLTLLKWKTIVVCRNDVEVLEAKQKVRELVRVPERGMKETLMWEVSEALGRGRG